MNKDNFFHVIIYMIKSKNIINISSNEFNVDDNIVINCKLGNFYYNTEKNYELAKKYYLMAIDKNNLEAMNNLGTLYYMIEKNYELAKKYYLMAIDNDNDNSMFNLGNLYHMTEQQYELAKKYYLMAIDKGNSNAMASLGNLYYIIENKYELAIKYYLMAIDKENPHAMNNLGHIYYTIEKNYKLTDKYYLMSITHEKNIINLQNNIKFDENTREQHIYKNKRTNFMKIVECPICMVDKECIPFECTHYFCDECYIKYYNKSCPICRL